MTTPTAPGPVWTYFVSYVTPAGSAGYIQVNRPAPIRDTSEVKAIAADIAGTYGHREMVAVQNFILLSGPSATPTAASTPSWVLEEQLSRLRREVGGLRRWLSDQLDGVCDPQHVAEVVLLRLEALEGDVYLPPTDSTPSSTSGGTS